MPSPHASGTAGDQTPRTGWPLPIDDAFSLSPLLNSLPFPSITGISEMSGMARFFPRDTQRGDVSAWWGVADLDGKGVRRVLLLTSPVIALQVYANRDGVIPEDPQVTETYPPPEEVVSIPTLEYEDAKRSALPGAKLRDGEGERVLCAQMMDRSLWRDGPVVGLITCSGKCLALVLVSLTSGKVFRRIDLGKGEAASLASSSRGVVVTLPGAVHVLDCGLEPVTAILGLPAHPATSLPVTSLSGRLLAYATDEVAAIPGPEGLGSITVVSKTKEPKPIPANASPQSTQGAILTSAVEIGGGVARGVWAGLKLGARAANDARNSRLARSAPSERSMLDANGSVANTEAEPESRSVEDNIAGTMPPRSQGVWVKIIDIASKELNVIAHFRLPPSRHLVPPLPSGSHSKSGDQPIAFMSFSPQGTRLFVAPADGRAFHILDVRPRGAEPGKGTRGEVWNQYVLRRGNTPATVSSVTWSKDERWIAVGTGRGTIHVFAITPGGNKPSSATQVPLRIVNSSTLQPLGLEIYPVARLRPSGTLPEADAEAEARIKSHAFATFTAMRPHPSAKGVLCQDVAVYRSGLGQLDLVRLTVKATTSRVTAPDTPASRRGSNLTEMLREKSGLRADSDLDVEHIVKARWALPLGRGDVRVSPGHEEAEPQRRIKNHAEIRTHSASPRILPPSIYLCHQAEFFAATPTDEYQPLSVLDKVARTNKLTFRPEVEATPGPRSDDLNTALHSVLDKPSPQSQLPRLPNGSDKTQWGSVPIRLAANLGEGVDRVRSYARAQARRRTSGANGTNSTNGTPLSFEDDTVFAGADGEEESPPPGPPVDDDWGERWEDEYKRAVEDEGGPEDLVLGMLDEEEEERREVERKRKK